MTEKKKDEKIEELSDRIAQLEASLRSITRPYADLVSQLDQFQGIVQGYFRLLDLYQKHGVISVDVILPEVKDRISKEIMRILLDHSGYNITEIADELRSRTGSSSRRIVREKLRGLVAQGMVTEIRKGKIKTYAVSEQVIRKWSQVLGLTK